MEDLTKQQLILLALLVSFVTSIATGIATVSLLDQAPPKVTQVINRVVERTVERVAPTQAATPGQVVTKEETIVVREDELITESIASASESIVRIFDRRGETFIGMGFVAEKSSGTIVGAAEGIDERDRYTVRLPGGIVSEAEIQGYHPDQGIAVLRVTDEGATGEVSALSLGTAADIQLGASVLVVSGRERNQVAMGIVSGFEHTAVNQGGEEVVTGITTTVAPGDVLVGTPLLNLFGEVIGVKTAADTAIFLPIEFVAPLLANE